MTDAPVAHQFDDRDQQREAVSLGMWTFLATEILFFGGLFTSYIVYRTKYPEAFAEASHHLYMSIGTVNTAVLLTSSLTMALAVQAAGQLKRRKLLVLLLATALLGSLFLGLKGLEYWLDYREHIVPGSAFQWHGQVDARQAQLFFVIYFIMTGLHAVHMIIGVAVVVAVAALAYRTKVLPGQRNRIEMVGLYWHFVDLVWVFLFPLFYLVG